MRLATRVRWGRKPRGPKVPQYRIRPIHQVVSSRLLEGELNEMGVKLSNNNECDMAFGEERECSGRPVHDGMMVVVHDATLSGPVSPEPQPPYAVPNKVSSASKSATDHTFFYKNALACPINFQLSFFLEREHHLIPNTPLLSRPHWLPHA